MEEIRSGLRIPRLSEHFIPGIFASQEPGGETWIFDPGLPVAFRKFLLIPDYKPFIITMN
jgi:hypothetical protein